MKVTTSSTLMMKTKKNSDHQRRFWCLYSTWKFQFLQLTTSKDVSECSDV